MIYKIYNYKNYYLLIYNRSNNTKNANKQNGPN